MQYIPMPTGDEVVYWIESDDAADLTQRAAAAVAAFAATLPPFTPFLITSFSLAGGGFGAKFVASIGFSTSLSVIPSPTGPFIFYEAANAEALDVARANAANSGSASPSFTIFDEQLAGAQQGTKFMGALVYSVGIV